MEKGRERNIEQEVSIENAPEGLRDYIKKIEFIRERINEMNKADAEAKANEVRARMSQEGIRMETLMALVNTLEQTNFEAFEAIELNEIVALLDYLRLEWDPALRPFLDRVIQILSAAISIKRLAEKK